MKNSSNRVLKKRQPILGPWARLHLARIGELKGCIIPGSRECELSGLARILHTRMSRKPVQVDLPQCGLEKSRARAPKADSIFFNTLLGEQAEKGKVKTRISCNIGAAFRARKFLSAEPGMKFPG